MDTRELPKISVVIVTYNRADLLPKAVASVLEQSCRDFELVIVDDGSLDGTEAFARSLAARDKRVRYFKNESNLGISRSRNRGVALARGEYVAMLDSDDYWIGKDKLKIQAAHLDKHPEIGLIGTAIRCEDGQGRILKEDIFETEDRKIKSRMLMKNQIAQSSILFRKEAYAKAGGYDESFVIDEDYDLWLKIGKDWKLANLPDVMVAYLVHPGGITKEKRFLTISATDKLIRRYRRYYPHYLLARSKSFMRFLRALL